MQASKRSRAAADTGPWLIEKLASIPVLGIGQRVRHGYQQWLTYKFRRNWHWRNALAKEAYEANPPTLSAVQQRVVDDLVDRGIAYVPFSELIADPIIWNRLDGLMKAWLACDVVKEQEHAFQSGQGRAGTRKEYLIKCFGEDASFSLDHPWFSLGLRAEILNIVNSYFGMMSKLIACDLWNTMPSRADSPITGSQRWHRDPEDVKIVKTFLYFSDVDEAAGPLHYVPNSRKGEKYGHLWPQEHFGRTRPTPDVFESAIPRSDWEICAKPKGTFVFVDTTGFHMGGRATLHRRVFAIWAYVTQASLWPRAYALNPEPDAETLSLSAQFALLK